MKKDLSTWQTDRKTGDARQSKRNDGRIGGHAKKRCAFNGDLLAWYGAKIQQSERGVVNVLNRHDELKRQLKQTGQSFDLYANSASGIVRGRVLKTQVRPKSKRPLCGARCRSGEPCAARVCVRPDGNGLAKRCRLHGGLTPRKPKSPEGRAAIAAANRARSKQ
jgi:hypothetical protein